MRKFLVVLLVASSLALVGCSRQQPELVGAQSDGIPADTVLITHVSFIPRVINIQAGQSITWQWDDGASPHNVSLTDLGIDSGNRTTGTWTYKFGTPGVYNYRCTLHNNMLGQVIVH